MVKCETFQAVSSKVSHCGCRIVNFFYKNVVPNGVLWWFQIYASWSAAVYVLYLPG